VSASNRPSLTVSPQSNSVTSSSPITIDAASGSTQKLYSAAGVTFPRQFTLPPITHISSSNAPRFGSFRSASATFVSGAMQASVISPGLSRAVSTM
jgi:hypothetical protein